MIDNSLDRHYFEGHFYSFLIQEKCTWHLCKYPALLRKLNPEFSEDILQIHAKHYNNCITSACVEKFFVALATLLAQRVAEEHDLSLRDISEDELTDTITIIELARRML